MWWIYGMALVVTLMSLPIMRKRLNTKNFATYILECFLMLSVLLLVFLYFGGD